MTIDEAIEELEERKAFLKRTCEHCWDDAIELALQALKEKKEGGFGNCTDCVFFDSKAMFACIHQEGMLHPRYDDYCSRYENKGHNTLTKYEIEKEDQKL